MNFFALPLIVALLVPGTVPAQVLVIPETTTLPATYNVPNSETLAPNFDETSAYKGRCPTSLYNVLGKWRSKGSTSPYDTIEVTLAGEKKVFRVKPKHREDADAVEIEGTWAYRNCRLQVFLPDEDTSYDVLILPQAQGGPLTGPSLSLKKLGEPFRAPYTRASN